MGRYKITMSYDGTGYAGWQTQPGHRTIQQTLQDAVRRITQEAVTVHCSGRTDQGVHARMQVVHVDLTDSARTSSLKRALNAVLPPDIRVDSVRKAGQSFDARRSVLEKEYRYFIWNGDVLPPFLRAYRCHVWGKLDVKKMNAAAAMLVGRHDFAAFTANPNRFVESTVRTLAMLEVRKRGREIVIIARGEGFLYRMVRSLAGFLIRVGQDGAKAEDAGVILRSRTRTGKVPTAPPQGLFLWDVKYPGGRKEKS